MDYEKKILIMFHCEQHTGYAIEKLEGIFHKAALLANYSQHNVFYSYKKISDTHNNLFECDYNNENQCHALAKSIAQHNIQTVLAFDLAYPAKVIPHLRNAGITKIISYWGAGMSSINTGLKLFLKKIEWYLRKHKPDFFIFESDAMQTTATHGRGVPRRNTHVIPLGVNTEHYRPDIRDQFYAHNALNIPQDRNIIFYSGHMEQRKGIATIMRTADYLVSKKSRRDLHFVLCGNKNNEESVYIDMLKDSPAIDYVTFAGYRNDLERLHRSSKLGVIASSGWDSFTMSSIEMMSSGLPMVVSKLQGLQETIEDNVNGFFFEPENVEMFASKIVCLIDDENLQKKFSTASRIRATEIFSMELQIERLSKFIGVK